MGWLGGKGANSRLMTRGWSPAPTSEKERAFLRCFPTSMYVCACTKTHRYTYTHTKQLKILKEINMIYVCTH